MKSIDILVKQAVTLSFFPKPPSSSQDWIWFSLASQAIFCMSIFSVWCACDRSSNGSLGLTSCFLWAYTASGVPVIGVQSAPLALQVVNCYVLEARTVDKKNNLTKPFLHFFLSSYCTSPFSVEISAHELRFFYPIFDGYVLSWLYYVNTF